VVPPLQEGVKMVPVVFQDVHVTQVECLGNMMSSRKTKTVEWI